MYTTYILYSRKLQKYYVGFTSMKMEERLQRHLRNHKGFTGRADDWQVVYSRSFSVKMASIRLESKIKKRGAARFLNDQNTHESIDS